MIEAVRQALRGEMRRIAEEETEAAVKRVIQRVSANLDGYVLQMMSRYSIEQQRGEILIRVDKSAFDVSSGS